MMLARKPGPLTRPLTTRARDVTAEGSIGVGSLFSLHVGQRSTKSRGSRERPRRSASISVAGCRWWHLFAGKVRRACVRDESAPPPTPRTGRASNSIEGSFNHLRYDEHRVAPNEGGPPRVVAGRSVGRCPARHRGGCAGRLAPHRRVRGLECPLDVRYRLDRRSDRADEDGGQGHG